MGLGGNSPLGESTGLGAPPGGWVPLLCQLSLCWLVVSDLLLCGCGHRPAPLASHKTCEQPLRLTVGVAPCQEGADSLSVLPGHLAGRCDWAATAGGWHLTAPFSLPKASSVGRLHSRPPGVPSPPRRPPGLLDAEAQARLRSAGGAEAAPCALLALVASAAR